MLRLKKWLAKQRQNQEKVVYLEEALLTSRFTKYAFFRLKYFLLNSACRTALHVIEFVFLYFMFSEELFITALVVKSAAVFIKSFWWGALEVMRSRTREFLHSMRRRRIGRELSRWIGVSIGLSAMGAIALVAGTVAFLLVRSDPLTPFHLYFFAVALSVVIEFGLRCFHSGAYAMQRIYRPPFVMVGSQFLGFALIWLCWPWLGSWAFAGFILLNTLLSGGLTYYFTAKVYRFLGIELHVNTQRLRSFLKKNLRKEFFLAGSAYAFLRLDSVIVVVLFFALEKRPGNLTGNFDLFLLFALISPLVEMGYDWAKLFYYDFKRLELNLFGQLKKRFQQQTLLLGGAIGLGLWAVSCAIGLMAFDKPYSYVYLPLGLFFVARSLLAFVQIKAFSYGYYGSLTLSGVALLVGLGGCLALSSNINERLGLFFAMMVGMLFFLMAVQKRGVKVEKKREVLSFAQWLSRLCKIEEPLSIRGVILSDQSLRQGVNTFARDVANRVAQEVGSHSIVTIGSSACVLWTESVSQKKQMDQILIQDLGGLVYKVIRINHVPNGLEAVSRLSQQQGFERLLEPEWLLSPKPVDISELKREFLEMFPQEQCFVLDSGRFDKRVLERFTNAQLKEVMRDALRHFSCPWEMDTRGRFDVTTLAYEGELQVIFIALRAPHLRHRSFRWRQLVHKANLQSALCN